MKMKKIILTLLTIIMLSSIAMADMAVYDESNNKISYDVELQLREGWNLIPATCNTGVPEIQSANIQTMFVYSPDLNEYINVYHKSTFLNENVLGSEEEYFCSAGWWAYVTKPSTFMYRTDYIPKTEDRQLMKGWNFVIITPDFEGKKFHELKGNCKFTKLYSFERANQKWYDFSAQMGNTEPYYPNSIGGISLVKSENSCKMNSKDYSQPLAILE